MLRSGDRRRGGAETGGEMAAGRRAKRQRSRSRMRQHAHAGGHANGAFSGAEDAEDHLLHMDPSLMTERQQLAFLLRTTAHEASTSEEHTHSSESSDDEEREAAATTARPRQRQARQDKRIGRQRARTAKSASEDAAESRGDVAEDSDSNAAAVAHRGHGHPPKKAAVVKPIKVPTTAHEAKLAVRTSPRTTHKAPVRAKTLALSDESARAASEKPEARDASPLPLPARCKPSPSSSSDVVHMGSSPFEHATGGDGMRCALCCDYETSYEASFSDALFLCPACDQKYPTQQALGRVCMT